MRIEIYSGEDEQDFWLKLECMIRKLLTEEDAKQRKDFEENGGFEKLLHRSRYLAQKQEQEESSQSQ